MLKLKVDSVYCTADVISLTMSQTTHLLQLCGIDAALMLVRKEAIGGIMTADKRAVVAIVLGLWLGCAGFSG